MTALHRQQVTFVSVRANITKLLLISLFWHSDQSKLPPKIPELLLQIHIFLSLIVTFQKAYYTVDVQDCIHIIFLIYCFICMQVDLLSREEHSPDPETSSKAKDKRPPSITIEKPHQSAHRWRECKIIGKNISIRSYGAACTFQNRLYLYGGYQILKGSLHDFYSISLLDTQQTYNWVEIAPKGNVSPGSREKHALVSTKTHIFLIGGLLINNTASNEIYRFDPKTHLWELMQPEGPRLPPLQSFGCTVVKTGGEQKVIIAFGFNQETASPSNAVYEYNPSNNKLKILFQGSREVAEGIPIPRSGCAMTSDDNNIYIFGGKNDTTRYNDLWSFSLTDFKFKRMSDDGELPAVRNGHSMNYYDGKLYVFGGIHDITWQLDDLHIYTLSKGKWTTLEHDSPRKIEKKANHENSLNDKEKEKISPKKKGWYESMGSAINRAPSPVSNKARNFSTTLMIEEGGLRNESPGKMLDEQRKKVFYQKKAEMLKNFEVGKEETSKYLSLQTSSQAMKISLDVIGNPDPKMKVAQDRLTDFGRESVSKFLGPLRNSSNVIAGKKPCARDGHCAVLMGQQLVICGGDRHQMSFNDIYKLDLSKAIPH